MTTIVLSKTTLASLTSLTNRIIANAKQGKDLENQVALTYGKCEPLVADFIWTLAQPFIKAIDKADTPEKLRPIMHDWYLDYTARVKELGEAYCEARGCKDNAWRTVVSRAKASLKEAGKKIPRIESQSDNAIQKRATKQPKAPQTPETNSGKASNVTPFDKKMSVSDIKREVGDTMANLWDTIQGHIPEGKRNAMIAEQTRFISAWTKILNAK